jgi:hypothetical protein
MLQGMFPSLLTGGGITDAAIYEKFFSSSFVVLSRPKSTWLALIAIFYSRRFLVPSLKLALFPAAALAHEYLGPRYMYLAVVASFVLEIVLE